MTVNFDELKKMDKKKLIELAKSINAPYHHLNSEKTLIENIINKVMEPQVVPPVAQDAELPPAPIVPKDVFLTEDDLEREFAPIKEKYSAFSTRYNHEDRCVTLIYNDGRYKHAETLNLSCSLARFKRKAIEIAKGPLILRAQSPAEWGSLSGINERNAYTNNVL